MDTLFILSLRGDFDIKPSLGRNNKIIISMSGIKYILLAIKDKFINNIQP
jgi:hypothetical protein